MFKLYKIATGCAVYLACVGSGMSSEKEYIGGWSQETENSFNKAKKNLDEKCEDKLKAIHNAQAKKIKAIKALKEGGGNYISEANEKLKNAREEYDECVEQEYKKIRVIQEKMDEETTNKH